MISEAQHLLETVAKSMARSVDGGWQQLELHITAAAGMTKTSLTATRADGGLDRHCELDDEGEDAAADLREAMFQSGKGTWYNAQLTLDAGGKFDADFDYDKPPFDGRADQGLLVEDQRQFPRDSERLAEWHPSSEREASRDR